MVDNVVPFERTSEYWLARAQRLNGQSRNKDAVRLLIQACKTCPDATARLELAKTYHAMNCATAAQREIRHLLSQDPDCAAAYLLLARRALFEGLQPLAENALIKCLHTGTDALVHDDAQDILTDYPWTDAVVHPVSARASVLFDQAIDALEVHDEGKAVQKLLKSLRRKPLPQAQALLGEMCLRAGKNQEAAALLKAAVITRELPFAYTLLLCEAILNTGDAEVAYVLLSSRLPASMPMRYVSAIVRMSLKVGNAQGAHFFLMQQLQSFPYSADLYYLSAVVARAMGNDEDVRRYLHMALEIDPKDMEVVRALKCPARWQGSFKRFDIGLEALGAMCDPEPPTGDVRFKRLVHGLTISLGGALKYKTVCTLVQHAWQRMSYTQKRQCDRARDMLWQRAFYRYLAQKAGISAAHIPLYKASGQARRVERMVRFIKANEAWSEVQ